MQARALSTGILVSILSRTGCTKMQTTYIRGSFQPFDNIAATGLASGSTRRDSVVDLRHR